MIRVLVLYPNEEGGRFDYDYYVDTHMAMVKERFGQAMKGFQVDKGLSGIDSKSPPSFVVATHIFFDSKEDFEKAFAEHAKALLDDIPNYTNLQPRTQIDEIGTVVPAG